MSQQQNHLLRILTICATFLNLATMMGGVYSYPLLVEVPEETERCFRFNVPEDDDAHMVFVALPSVAEPEDGDKEWSSKMKQLEEYYVEQTFQLTKFRNEGASLPRRFPTQPPEDITKLTNEVYEDNGQQGRSGCQVRIYNPQSSSSRTMETFFFNPVVLNYVRKALRSHPHTWEAPPLEGYAICFNNLNEEEEVQMVMEVVMVSDEGDSEDETGDGDGGKKKFDASHLTPLAEQLAESINAAQSVIREMQYMEKREQRMRLTADSINSRVRYFSYISVGMLLVVTYIQVTYLKRYFRKKKLL